MPEREKQVLSGATRQFPPVPQGVYGVCEGCGAVAWELLNDISPLCIGCAPWDYSRDDEDEDDNYDDWECA